MWTGFRRWRLVVAVAIATVLQAVVLFYVLVAIGTSTGYIERRNNEAAKDFQLPGGRRLADEVSRRLAERGVSRPLRWTTVDWGGTSTTTACTEPEMQVCLAFEFYRWRREMEARNPLAKTLFPELSGRELRDVWPLDRDDVSSLERVRHRNADVELTSPADVTP